MEPTILLMAQQVTAAVETEMAQPLMSLAVDLQSCLMQEFVEPKMFSPIATIISTLSVFKKSGTILKLDQVNVEHNRLLATCPRLQMQESIIPFLNLLLL